MVSIPSCRRVSPAGGVVRLPCRPLDSVRSPTPVHSAAQRSRTLRHFPRNHKPLLAYLVTTAPPSHEHSCGSLLALLVVHFLPLRSSHIPAKRGVWGHNPGHVTFSGRTGKRQHARQERMERRQHEPCQAAREVHTLSRRGCAHAASQCTEGQESCRKKVPQSREKRDGYALDEKTSGYPGMGGTVAEGEPASRTEGSRTKKMLPNTGTTDVTQHGYHNASDGP